MPFQHTIRLSTVLLSLGLAACHPGQSEDPAAARENLDRKLEPKRVGVVLPEVREERPSIDLVGEIRAFDTVTISSEVAGKVDAVNVEVGDRVNADQPLLSIDRSTFEIRLRQARARHRAARADLDLAERELERKKDLLSDQTIPQAVFDQAKARHDLAAAAVLEAAAARDLAEHDVTVAVVRAPAAGAITGRSVVVGQWADVGVGLLELAVGGRVKVIARVPAHWAGALRGLETFDFTVAPGAPPRRAELYSIDPVVSEASRSFEVVGTARADGLKPGVFATVTLRSPTTEHSLWLPASAVQTSDTPKVLMVEGGRVAVRRVQTGRRDDGMIEIVSGLEEGESVIVDVAGLSRDLPVEVAE